ncbi:HsdM family class I SAM-dependent methyltransferase, partial [Clostridium perfringens]|uniref:HsdM family class I SAM-dependent methyltransferase n=1 Tax=Clostridium perfringens TaxID=1502 RepID=UPI0018E40954
FEELVRRFSESYNEQAGAHFTSRDIIYLMTDLLIAEEKDALIEEGVVKTVYDQTMGTSQMLGCMEERLKLLDEEAEVSLFGQEINPETYAIAKADMLIKGGKADNMRQGNTLSDDKFKNYKFDYCISNPPFGIDWKVEKKAVEAEAKLGDMGRFGVGLPKINDGQQLFDLNGLDKLKDTGRMAIIHNGSPLFSGDAGSGSSEIRRYIIENDWLEAIVQLSTDAFYNTGITTYIWIMSKDKPVHRQGKVQLIDASNMYEKRRKSIGNKRNDITEECREVIVKAYGEFDNKVYTLGDKICESKIFDNVEFGYNKIVIESPRVDEEGNIIKKKNKPVANTQKRDTENVPLA